MLKTIRTYIRDITTELFRNKYNIRKILNILIVYIFYWHQLYFHKIKYYTDEFRISNIISIYIQIFSGTYVPMSNYFISTNR